jgi:trehalose/maltose hydrolase-like predicted phosphorylase
VTCPPDPAPGETWDLVFDTYDPGDERRRESLLALGNGVLLVRAAATCAVADAHHYPGTYRAGLYDRRDESVDGERVVHDALVNLPNWLPLAFRVRGETAWVSIATAEVLQYRHALDTRRGIAGRDVLLRDGVGRRTWLRERRLVSLPRPLLAALRLELAPDGWEGAVEIRSALDGRLCNGNWPQEAPGEHRLLDRIAGEERGGALLLRARLLRSRVAVAVAARTSVAGSEVSAREVRQEDGAVAEHMACAVGAGQAVRVEKTAAICTGRDAAIFDPSDAAVAAVCEAPSFQALQAEHEIAWGRLWERCGMDADEGTLGDALRLHAFCLLQTVSPHTAGFDAGLPARGWQEAYFGQVFWDQGFAFPFLALRLPGLARALLLYRCRRLGAAREAARQAGLRGAMFPWRSATTGREETPALQPNPLDKRWTRDDTRLQRHVSLMIARDAWHYTLATGDTEFLAESAAELVIEIARFWASASRHDPASGRYDIGGIVGPDEYHTRMPGADAPGIRTNAYTNVMAAWVLARVPELLDLLPQTRRAGLCRALRLGADEMAHWDLLSRRLLVAFHGDGIISQFQGYGELQPLDLEAFKHAHPGERVDLALQAEGKDANDYQITKQADFLVLPYLLPGRQLADTLARLGYAVPDYQLLRTARYYLARTSNDSSLSRIVCAGALARLDPAASWGLYHDALRLDLDPKDRGAAEGVHLGAMAATLDVMQRLYLGLDVDARGLALSPAPPPGLCPVRMGLHYRGGAFELAWTGSALRLASDAANLGEVTVVRDGQTEPLRAGETMEIARGAP